MKKLKRSAISIAVLSQLAGCTTLQTPKEIKQDEVEAINVEETFVVDESQTPTDAVPLQDLRLFSEILDEVHRNYVDKVDDDQLIQDSIRGMLSGLDPHSKFYSAEEFESFNNDADGIFTGIGVEIGTSKGEILVIAPIEDSPAFKAGILAGDIIRGIDDKAVEDYSVEDAVDLMRGEPGSEVKIIVERAGEDNVLTFDIVREKIQSTSVRSEMIDREYLLVRITQFQHDTYQTLVDQYNEKTTNNQLKGLVLDLRNNPGGLLQSAVDVSDAFLADGDIVFTRSRGKTAQSGYTASPPDIADNLPMIVLINSGSASASEIVAGALQDNKRAIVMGTRSFGKGSVQTIRQLSNGRAIKLTTARYYTPEERSIQAHGIEPDIEIPQLDMGEDIASNFSYREENLQGHLSNEVDGDNSTSGQDIASAPSPRLSNDYQLAQAIVVLKTLAFSKNLPQ